MVKIQQAQPGLPTDLGARLARLAELLDAAAAVLNETLREIKRKEEGDDGRS